MTDEHSHNQNMLLKRAKVMRIQHFNVSSYFNIYVCEVQLTANVPILNRDSLHRPTSTTWPMLSTSMWKTHQLSGENKPVTCRIQRHIIYIWWKKKQHFNIKLQSSKNKITTIYFQEKEWIKNYIYICI